MFSSIDMTPPTPRNQNLLFVFGIVCFFLSYNTQRHQNPLKTSKQYKILFNKENLTKVALLEHVRFYSALFKFFYERLFSFVKDFKGYLD